MDEEDDDFYAPSELVPGMAGNYEQSSSGGAANTQDSKSEKMDDELEEGEEEEEDEDEDESDSDIDIITDRKDGSKPEPPPQPARYSSIRNLPARTASGSDQGAKPPAKPATPTKEAKAVEHHPAVATSTLDIDAKPIYSPVGKPITEINIDTDLAEHEKPWRRPGSDVTDYFNYGFDEFTWTAYCEKQNALREEFDPKKMMEQMAMMTQQFSMGLPGLPPVATGPGSVPGPGQQGMPGPGGPGGPNMMNMPPMPGMEGMPPEMQAMMAQFIQQGGDPSQVDPGMFAAMQQAAGGQGPGGAPPQGYGGGPQQGYGQPQGPQGQQGMPGYGYDPSMMGDQRNRGNFGNRGGRGGGRRQQW